MRNSSGLSRSVGKRSPGQARVLSRKGTYLPRLVAITILLVYIGLIVAAYRSTLDPISLNIRFDSCGPTQCVSWVMPGSHAWDQKARTGMAVLSVNRESLDVTDPEALPTDTIQQVELRNPTGEILSIATKRHPVGDSPLKFSMWALGGMFALLGAVVFLRRPDLQVTRLFALFSGTTAIALGVGPSAGGSSPVWALAVQGLTMPVIGASFLPFVLALAMDSQRRLHVLLPAFAGLGVPLAAGYGIAVLLSPPLFEWIRPVTLLYLAISFLSGVGWLAFQAARHLSPVAQQQARIALVGAAMSTLPFASLTLVPEALGAESLLPVHFTILTVGFMPVPWATPSCSTSSWGYGDWSIEAWCTERRPLRR